MQKIKISSDLKLPSLSRQGLSRGCYIFVALFNLLYFLKSTPRHLLILRDYLGLITRGDLAAALLPSAIIVFWLVLSLTWLCSPRKAPNDIHFPWVSAGWALLILLLVDILFFHPGPLMTAILISLSFLFVAFFMGFRSPASVSLVPPDNQIRLVFLIFLALFSIRFLEAWAYLVPLKEAPLGDSRVFWVPSILELKARGMGFYVKSFPMSHYDPGYPVISNLLLAFIPFERTFDAAKAVPPLLGFFLFVSILRRRHPSFAWACILSVFGGLCLSHDWIFTLFFRFWYGEVIAVAAFVWLFVYLDSLDKVNSRTVVGGIGLGVICALSKPPLSSLLLPCFLPLYLAASFLRDRGREWRPIFYRLAILGIAAVLARMLWGYEARSHGLGSFYEIDKEKIFRPDFGGAAFSLMHYFFELYKIYWISFLGLSAAALLSDWRRYLPSLLVSWVSCLAIYVMYATIWTHVEYESGGRYFVHSMVGWMLFAVVSLAKGTPPLHARGD